MVHWSVAAAFQHGQETGDVGNVSFRAVQRIPHSRLSGEVNDGLGREPGHQRAKGGTVFKIQFGEIEARVGPEPGQPRFLQSHVVVAVQVIQPGDGPPVPEQAFRNMVADEACGAGYDDSAGRI